MAGMNYLVATNDISSGEGSGMQLNGPPLFFVRPWPGHCGARNLSDGTRFWASLSPVFSQQETCYGPGRRWRNWRRSYPQRIPSRDIKSSSRIGNRPTQLFEEEW